MKTLKLLSTEFIEEIQSTKNLSSKTVVAYKSDLKDFCEHMITQKLEDCTILKYVQYLSQERNLKDSTINRKLIVLKMFFQYLYDHRYIECNYYKLHVFRFKKEQKLPKTLTITDTAQILNIANRLRDSATTNYEYWKATRNLALIDVLISTQVVPLLLKHKFSNVFTSY